MLLIRFLQSVIVLSLLGIVLVLFQAGAASSGIIVYTADYRAPGSTQALNFERPEVFRVFHAELQSGRPDFYSFRARPGAFLKARLNTLRLLGQDNFRPALALFGPGLPVPTSTELNSLAFSMPPGLGLLVSAEEKAADTTLPPVIDEPWTQASYWERQNLLNELPQDGTYYLVVFSRSKQSGKYALAVGDQVEAGLRETLTFPVTWARTRLWFNDYWWPSFAAAVVALLTAALIYLYLRSLRRQMRSIAANRASRRRAALLRKRLGHTGWQKRRAIKPARYAAAPARFQPSARLTIPEPAAAAPIIIPAASEPLAVAPAGVVAASEPAAVAVAPLKTVDIPSVARPVRKPAGRLLLGSEWESVIGPATANGADPAASNGSSPAAAPDGLSRWGQRRRPQPEKSQPG